MKDAKKHTKRLRDLVIELTNFANIKRHIYLPDTEHNFRQENDAEHSYNLAMAAWFLSQYVPELDKDKVIRFALAHDLVELHAGDEMAIGRTKSQEIAKKKREEEALKKLKEDWPDFAEMTDMITEYEQKDTREALFVYALDKIMPMQLNLITKGKTWKSKNMNRSEVVSNKDEKTIVSAEINAIWQELRKEVLAHDEYFNSNRTD